MSESTNSSNETLLHLEGITKIFCAEAMVEAHARPGGQQRRVVVAWSLRTERGTRA